VRMAKLGITGINLPFAASNVAADLGHTAVTAANGRSVFSPSTFLRAFLAAVKHDALYEGMIRSGAGFTSFDLMRNQPRLGIEKIRASRSVGARAVYAAAHPVSTVGDLFRAAEDLVARSEEFGRARLFKGTKEAALKQGRTAEDADVLARLQANYGLPNYYRAGNWGRALNGAFLYLNAGIQGSRSFLRAVERDPVGTAEKVALALYVPVTIATLWNLSDEERRKAYMDLENYEKDNNLVLLPPIPVKSEDGKYSVIKLKLPPGLNQLTIPIRRGIEAMYDLDPMTFQEIANAVVGSVSPIEPTKRSILSNLVPQAVKPTVQATANYDFFRDRPKVSPGLQHLTPSMQVYPYTSETARKIGERIGVSPIIVEEFVKDTLGGVGSQLLNLSDRVLAAKGVIPEEQIGGQDPLRGIAARYGEARGGATEHREFERLRKFEQEAADISINDRRNAQALFARVQKAPPDQQKQLILDRIKAGMTDPEADYFMGLLQQESEGITPLERALQRSPVKARARFMVDELLRRPQGPERRALFDDWADKGLFTDEVVEEMVSIIEGSE
jgi:hypothetical protein